MRRSRESVSAFQRPAENRVRSISPLFLGIGPQQPQKFPLGQYDHLGKLLRGQVEQLLGHIAHRRFAFAFQQPEFPIFQQKSIRENPEIPAPWCFG